MERSGCETQNSTLHNSGHTQAFTRDSMLEIGFLPLRLHTSHRSASAAAQYKIRLLLPR